MPDPSAESLAAALADRYRVERELGAGGMATVYLAHDLRHDRKVALKVLRGDLAASLGPERFHREIRVAAALQHPHIVPLYDSGTAGNQLFYVMPFVEGQSLRQKLLKAGELPVADAVRILRDVADALGEAHRHGVVHRDLKPENIMLAGRHALVTDFGVAKAVSESTGRQTLTTLGVALGTPSYMAPEQATADPNTDHRADIYAFGVLAYELLAGRPPFAGGSPQEVLAAHVTQAAEPVTNVRPAVPPVLAGLVMRCLEKRPADRWQSTEELIPTLEAALTPSGGLAPTSAVAVSGTSPRRRLAAAFGGTAILALLGAGAWVVLGKRAKPAAPNATRVVVAWFDNRTGDSSLDDVGSLAAEWIIDGLAAQSFGELVPAVAVRELMSGDLATSATRARDLAARTNAGLLVTGSYFRRGDSLEYRAEVLNVVDGALLASAGPFRGLKDETQPLDSLFQRVAVAIGDRLVGGDYLASGMGRPANLDAWRAFQSGQEAFLRSQRDAVPHFREAMRRDPGWVAPYFWLWAERENAGRPAEADSILASASTAQLRVNAFDRLQLEYMAAATRGDEERAYQLAIRAAAEAPRFLAYTLALSAVRTGRFSVALEQLHLRDTTYFSREWGGWTSVHLSALHHLDGFDEEANVAREVVKTRGFTLARANAEVRPLAALGRTREVDSLLTRVWDEPTVGALAPADLAETAGWEYLAHGVPDRAETAFRRRLDWYSSRTAEQRAQHSAFSADFANALFAAGRFPEARAMFDSLTRAQPESPAWLGMLGATAAMMNDREAAMAADARLAAITLKYMNGAHQMWRGRIAALLGDCPRAVELLRSALRDGQSYNNLGHHWFASLGRARECAGLKEALKPRT